MTQHRIPREAELYDVLIPDWPGELAFYQSLLAAIPDPYAPVLEVACGTGRIVRRLARSGRPMVGIDSSPAMLTIARKQSTHLANLVWVEGSMPTFRLNEQFALILIPGHSFQFMLTPADQRATLICLKDHLTPNGSLVIHLDHQSLAWLGTLVTDQGGVFHPTAPVLDPVTGHTVQATRAWWYASATQTATVVTRRVELGLHGQIVAQWDVPPMDLHCVFRFEMEHLLQRVGLAFDAVYGDFFGTPLQDTSTEMIWVIRKDDRADSHQ